MKSLPYLCSLSLMAFLFAPALSVSTAQAGEALHDGDNVAVCGDSITEQKMYSVLIEDYLLMCQPASHLAAHQFGWGGETAPQLFARMKNDALLFHPTVATTCYGMNDGGYIETKPDRIAKYKQGMEDIVKTFKDGGVRFIVVGSPGIVDPESFKNAHFIHASGETYNKTLGDFSDVAKAVADENGVAFADVHGAMVSAYAKSKTVYGPDFVFTDLDGIHPQMLGHVVMAYAFLKALGCTGDIGTITVDMTTNQTDVDAGQKVVSSNNGTIELVSSRYPFCFPSDASPRSARAALPLIPFNEELNRYMLVVKNLSGSKAKVTWGTNSKEYSAADLAKGINLAAEFPDNPFSDQFEKVEEAIKKQQNYETPAVKSALHAIPDLFLVLPEKKDEIQSLRDTVIQKSVDLSTAAQQAVTPVQHTITITPES